MRSSRLAVLTTAAIGAVLAGLLTPAASYAGPTTAPSAPYDVVAMQGPTGGWLVSGTQVWDAAAGATVEASGGTPDGAITGEQGGHSLGFGLQPPTGTGFATGHFDTARDADATHARLDVDADGSRGCSSVTGTMDIREVTLTGGELATFAADFTVVCDGSTYAGVIRYHSSVGYTLASVSPDSLTIPTSYLQATSPAQTVTLTSLGSDPLTPGAAAVSGADAGSFAVSQDGCAGTTLAYGQTCTVSVTARPEALGQLDAVLSFADGSPRGTQELPLRTDAANPSYGLYYPVPSSRILDTRTGNGAAKHPVKGGTTVHLQVLGRGHVPRAGTSAVVLNLTVTRPTSSGYVTVYPTGKARPNVSSINYGRGWTGANLITVPIGANGMIDLYNSSGYADLVADVQGWYTSVNAVSSSYGIGGSYQPMAKPFRVMDTRTDFGHHDPLPGGYQTELGVWFNGVTQPQVRALAITVTATGVRASGYVTAFSSTTDPTRTSTLNLQPGVTTANLAFVPTDPCQESWCNDGVHSTSVIDVYNGSSRPVDILVDVTGFYGADEIGDGLRFHPLTSPVRIVDTRSARGTTRLGANSTHAVTAPAAVAGYNTVALAANVTAVTPSASTYLTLWPQFAGATRPTVSNLNPTKGVTVADGANLAVGDTSGFNIYNHAGSTDVLVDVSGTFEIFPAITPPGLRANGSGRPAAVQHRAAQPFTTHGTSALAAPRARPRS